MGAEAATPSPYWREVTALRQLGRHGRPLSAGVELIVFRNINNDQALEEYTMDQPLAEWLRSTVRDPRRQDGFRYLARAQEGDDPAEHLLRGVKRVSREHGGPGNVFRPVRAGQIPEATGPRATNLSLIHI